MGGNSLGDGQGCQSLSRHRVASPRRGSTRRRRERGERGEQERGDVSSADHPYPSLKHERGAEIHAIELLAGSVLPVFEICLERDLLDWIVGAPSSGDRSIGRGILRESGWGPFVRVEFLPAAEEDERLAALL